MTVNPALNPLVSVLRHVFVAEVGVILDHGFEAVVEHDRGCHEVAA